jgi:NAD(P)-dependent dehydrogenase (short-subunit alcohol dehydrogenase family)
MANILITGANRGIGLELVKLYAAAGDTVLACCRDTAAADDLRSVDGDVQLHEVQISDDASVAALAATIGSEPVDLLINNAGMAGPSFDEQTAQKMDYAGWAETFEVNTIAPVRVMQALLENLQASDSGKVVTITSQMGALSLDMPVAYAYSTSKAAVNKFMKLAAMELGQLGISVCVIHPGYVQTAMGGPNAEISAEESARGIKDTIAGLSAETNGSFWKWDGTSHDW